MKKKLVIAMLSLSLAVSFTACGGTNQKTATKQTGKSTEIESEKPTDLTGTWKTPEEDGSWQEATITPDKIEINWVSDNGNTKSVYWIGSYDAPTESVSEYSWTSNNDKDATANALLASPDDTKEFKYKDGEITYEASALGVTKVVHMKKAQ